MKIYVYEKCSTCKQALLFLKQNQVTLEIREITKTPPSLGELKLMLDYQGGNLKKLFNTSGNLYRELQLSEKFDKLSQEDLLTLLTTHGMLVKRPFLLGHDFGFLGFKEIEWSKKFK